MLKSFLCTPSVVFPSTEVNVMKTLIRQKKKDTSCTCKHFKIYLLDLDCHIICDILTSTFNILLEAAFKRKKKGPMMKFTGTSAPSFCSSFTMKCFWCHSISQRH